MDRRRFIGNLAFGTLAVPHVVRGQPAATIRRVGLLSSGSKAATANLYAAFKQGMQDLGWLGGNNVEYRFGYADGVVDRLHALAVELVGQKVEVIVVGNVPSVRAVQRATKAIPIVMTNVNNALGNGFVASLAKPGGNITGITTQAEEVIGKLFGILHEVAPDARRIASAGLAMVVLEHTKTIPVVALNAGELQAEPGVRSLAKPGANLTGMQLFSPETMGKRLQLLQEVVPGLRRVAVLRGVPWSRPGYELYRDATATAAARLGIRVRFLQFETIRDLNRLFDEMVREQDQALLVWANPHLNGYRKEIFDLTIRNPLPAIHDIRVYAAAR